MLLCSTSIFQLSTYLALTIQPLMLSPATTLLSFPVSSPRSSKCPFLNLSGTCWWRPDPTGYLTSGQSCSGTPGSGNLYSHPKPSTSQVSASTPNSSASLPTPHSHSLNTSHAGLQRCCLRQSPGGPSGATSVLLAFSRSVVACQTPPCPPSPALPTY